MGTWLSGIDFGSIFKELYTDDLIRNVITDTMVYGSGAIRIEEDAGPVVVDYLPAATNTIRDAMNTVSANIEANMYYSPVILGCDHGATFGGSYIPTPKTPCLFYSKCCEEGTCNE